MSLKYCRTCGKQLVEAETNDMYSNKEYDGDTGKVVMRHKCPTDICEHTGCGHDWRPKRWSMNERCTKCNMIKIAY